MKILRKSTTDEAVLEWLKAELNSERFRHELNESVKALGLSEDIITKPQMGDKTENIARRKILYGYRDWLDEDLDNYDWQLVELSIEEVKDLNYIDYSYWNELSDGSLRVDQAVKNIQKGRSVFNVSNDGFYSIAKDVNNRVILPPIILITQEESSLRKIIEGHLRATGFVLSQNPNITLKALWGQSHKIIVDKEATT